MHNADALYCALEFCADNGIGAFRINSQILPVKTHPDAGYELHELPEGDQIVARFEQCGNFGLNIGIRTSFHPDQFLVLSSPDAGVVKRSVADLEYHAQVAEWVSADVINIHGGGAYGDKRTALKRLASVINRLSPAVKSRLTLENDDQVYAPADLLPVCRATGVPLVYDVHHHRCLPDGKSVEDVTSAAISTWHREPLFHLSSPLNGWETGPCRPHHDFIDPADFPDCWRDLDITVDVEAKAKELAVLKLKLDLAGR
jgi:UV DNA damage endonuclease